MNNWQEATLVKIIELTPQIKSLTFHFKKPQKIIPGQFYILKTKKGEREYSVINLINQTDVEFGVQLIKHGEVSSFLHSLKINEKLKLKGPMGKYFNLEQKKEIIYISGGAGILPFFSFINMCPQEKFRLIASFKTQKDIPYFQKLKNNKNINLFITLTQENWSGPTGRLNKEVLKKHKLKNKNCLYYICGKSSFVESMSKILHELGVNEKNLRRERFG